MDPAGESHRLGSWVHRSLLFGLILSALMLVGGLVLSLVGHQARPGGPPHRLGALLRGAVGGDGVAVMDLGLLVLMATPMARVAVLAVGWGLGRRWRFLAVALTVLGLLVLSLALGVG